LASQQKTDDVAVMKTDTVLFVIYSQKAFIERRLERNINISTDILYSNKTF
jgi:hypothetical protein